MWPFQPKTQSDKAMAIAEDAIRSITLSWPEFQGEAIWDGVTLRNKINVYRGPATKGLRAAFPVLQQSPDDFVFLLIVQGIGASGLHARDELEAAVGFEIPQ